MANTEFDLASLLDGTLDDLADRPEFLPFVPGAHRVKLQLIQDEKKASVLYASCVLLETLEQADPNDTPMELGAKFRARMDLSNKFGQGDMKMILAAASSIFNERSVSKLIESLKSEGMECSVVTENRKNGDKVYTSITACEA